MKNFSAKQREWFDKTLKKIARGESLSLKESIKWLRLHKDMFPEVTDTTFIKLQLL